MTDLITAGIFIFVAMKSVGIQALVRLGPILTNWGLNKMTNILYTTFWLHIVEWKVFYILFQF